MKKIVVIPTYNEGEVLYEIVNKSLQYADFVIIVDDGSDLQKAPEFLKFKKNENRVCLLRHKINLGKGAALKTGCEAALLLHADEIVVMDSDGQHKPEDIKRLSQVLVEKNVDIIFGSRKIGKDMPFIMMLGNKFLSLATSFLFGIYISDTQSGFRAFTAASYKKIKWNSSRYSVETEMIANVAKNKLKFVEIEIETIYTDDYKGTTVFDGIKIFINMLIWKLI